MLWKDLIWGVLFLCQACVGVLGNSVLLMVYINIFVYQSHQKKPTDLIIVLLTLVNTTALATRGVPMAMASFGLRNIVDEVGCAVLYFTFRLSRGLSICITCLLSMFQAITISPSTSRWARLKYRAPNYILPSFLFFWILNFFIYLGTIFSSHMPQNVSDSKYTFISKSCSILPKGTSVLIIVCLNAMTLRDLFFVGLMSWASGYMVIVLYRHRKQVQHIHSTSVSQKSSTENKATQNILLLVTFFVCFYWINCSITVYSSVIMEYNALMQNTTAFLTACYPFFCPFLLISTDARVHFARCILRKVGSFFSRDGHGYP